METLPKQKPYQSKAFPGKWRLRANLELNLLLDVPDVQQAHMGVISLVSTYFWPYSAASLRIRASEEGMAFVPISDCERVVISVPVRFSEGGMTSVPVRFSGGGMTSAPVKFSRGRVTSVPVKFKCGLRDSPAK